MCVLDSQTHPRPATHIQILEEILKKPEIHGKTQNLLKFKL